MLAILTGVRLVVYVSIFVPLLGCFWLCDITEIMIPPVLLLLPRVTLATLGLLCLHVNFRIFLVLLLHWYFDRD